MTEKEFDDKYERWVVQKSQNLVRMHIMYNPSDPNLDPNVAVGLMREIALAGGAFVRDFCDTQFHLMRVQMAEYRTLLSQHSREIRRLQGEVASKVPTVTPVPDTEGRKFREE